MKDKNLLIGAVDLAPSLLQTAGKTGWDYIKNWAISSREHLEDNVDIALLCYRITPDIIENCKKLAIECFIVDYDQFGNELQFNVQGKDTIIHQIRFMHAWHLLFTNKHWQKYDYVLMTDIKDVIFQGNAFEWIEDHKIKILATSEGCYYKDEKWNLENLKSSHGPYIATEAINSNWICYNVGCIAGESKLAMDMFQLLFSMSTGKSIPNDQSNWGCIVNSGLFNGIRIGHEAPFVCHAGVTLDPSKNYNSILIEPKPIIKNGEVYTGNTNEKFKILHQYDRVPELKNIIEQKYV